MTEKNGRIYTLDICGQICPSCLLISLKEVNRHRDLLSTGGEQHIYTDTRHAINTTPSTVNSMGYDTEVVKSKGRYCIEIRKL